MAPTLVHSFVTKFSARTAEKPTNVFAKGPLIARTLLLARDSPTPTVKSGNGVTPPTSINNNGMFALFGILGAAICVTMIWFFFWAKNGGFYFKKNDWDDYKSTVLRRKGPNGTILSNATPSTNLGGGSIYKDVDDYTEDGTTTVISGTTATSGSTDLTGITGGVSDVSGREKRRKKREQREREKEREKERRREEKLREKAEKKARGKESKNRSSRKVNEEGVLVDEEAEAEAQAYLRDYRHEKPARVGGLNKAGDGSTWDGSNPSASTAAGTESTVTSDLMSNRERTPTNTPTKKAAASSGGIRKVYSTADRNATREQERIRAEARRLQERGHRASHSASGAAASGGGRRDFSWQYGEDASTPLRQIEETDSSRADDDGRSHVPGAWTDSGVPETDLGTKSYRHVIPGLSTSSAYSGGSATGATETQDFAYAEEKRKQRQQRNSGYRR